MYRRVKGETLLSRRQTLEEFALLVKHCKQIQELRQEYGADYPVTQWMFIEMFNAYQFRTGISDGYPFGVDEGVALLKEILPHGPVLTDGDLYCISNHMERLLKVWGEIVPIPEGR